MRRPFQMYSKLGDLKIIKQKNGGTSIKGKITPYKFVGVINHKITSGLIISSKIKRLRKDGMYIKYYKNHYLVDNSSKNLGLSLRTLPLPIEFKINGMQIMAKKYL